MSHLTVPELENIYALFRPENAKNIDEAVKAAMNNSTDHELLQTFKDTELLTDALFINAKLFEKSDRRMNNFYFSHQIMMANLVDTFLNFETEENKYETKYKILWHDTKEEIFPNGTETFQEFRLKHPMHEEGFRTALLLDDLPEFTKGYIEIPDNYNNVSNFIGVKEFGNKTDKYCVLIDKFSNGIEINTNKKKDREILYIRGRLQYQHKLKLGNKILNLKDDILYQKIDEALKILFPQIVKETFGKMTYRKSKLFFKPSNNLFKIYDKKKDFIRSVKEEYLVDAGYFNKK